MIRLLYVFFQALIIVHLLDPSNEKPTKWKGVFQKPIKRVISKKTINCNV